MTDEEIYELARTEYMEGGDSKGEWWARAMRHHTRMILDDMREWYETADESMCPSFSEMLDAYAKDRGIE